MSLQSGDFYCFYNMIIEIFDGELKLWFQNDYACFINKINYIWPNWFKRIKAYGVFLFIINVKLWCSKQNKKEITMETF